MRNLVILAALLLAGCTHDQIQTNLKNAADDAQTVAPILNKIVCLDAAGAAISGPLLTATGNDAGQVVGDAGAVIAKQACPAGTTPAAQ